MSNHDPAKPWRTVSATAVTDKEWWNENLQRPTILHLAHLQSAATAAVDDTVQPALERSDRNAPGAWTQERSRGSRMHPRKSQESSGSVSSRKG